MTEHELEQMQHYEDKCIKETEGWLCHECAKKLDYEVEEKEIAKRMIEKFMATLGQKYHNRYLEDMLRVCWKFKDWLDKEEKWDTTKTINR